MKKMAITSAGIFAGLAMSVVAIPAVSAQTIVKQIDDDTLQVIDYRGKPPFKRQIISLSDTNAAEFARFEERVETSPKPFSGTARRAGPQGKSVPYARQGVSGQPEEIAEFSRFEETDGQAAKSHRLWHGAPGKSRRLLTD